MGRREAFPENAGAAASAVAPRLPLSALLAMAMSGFVAILSETLPAGLLPQIGAGLAVSEALAGQLVSVYALGSLLAALPAASLTQGWRRRRVLLLALLIFFVCNSLTAVSSDYRLTLLARFGSGVAAGLAWGLLAGYARRLVPPEQQGRALAVAMLGAPLALSLGVPLGTWLGGLLGWRWAFGLLSLTALLLVGWVLRSVPDFPGQPAGRRLRLLGVLRTPGVRPVLLVIVAWVLAHNILYTYIAPFLAKVGLGASVDLALLVFGSAAVAGIWLVGVLVDRHLRRMVLVSLALFAVAALALCLGARWSWLAFAGLALWGLTFGGAATLLQTASPLPFAGPKRFHAPPVALADLPPIRGVILSHDHYDHLDRAAIKALVPLVELFLAPLGVGDRLLAWGVPPGKVRQLDWWQGIEAGGLRLTATPAQHFSGRGLHDGNRTLWCSWVIESAELKLFFSGDSGYFDGFAEIGRRYGPFDLTMLETGAYNEHWPYVHMHPQQTLQAHRDLGGRWLLPIHNGTFDLAMHAWYEPFERILELATEHGVRVSTPMMGERIDLQAPHAGRRWWREVVDSETQVQGYGCCRS